MKSYIILHKMIHRLIEGQINKLKTKVKQSRTQLKMTVRLNFSWYLSVKTKRPKHKK